MSRWICTTGCRALGQNFRKDDIIDHPTNPDSANFEAYSGDAILPLNRSARTDLDSTYYYPKPGWEDMTFSATRIRQGALLKPDYDYTRLGLLMPQDDPDEKFYINDQFRHSMYTGPNAVIRPHIHWLQESADVPVWKMDYRFHVNGQVEASWVTGVETTGEAFTYSSGDLTQISTFPWPSVEGLTVSALFDFIIYREDNVVSGDVLLKSFDFHYKWDSLGSGREYYK